MNKFKFVLFLLLSITLFQSCAEDDTILDDGAKEVAPELPPKESFIMPFDGFENTDTSGIYRAAASNRTVTSFGNWFYSAVNVVVWNTAITLNVWLPVASFGESFNHQPEFLGNKTWLWAYDFTAQDNSVYSAELTGKRLDTGEIEWEMKMSKVGGFTDVVWYTGLTAEDNSYANWTLYHRANNPEALMDIAYERDDVNRIESIRYTNIRPNNVDNGDYIEFRNTNDATSEYNKSYDVFRAQTDNLLEINWNDPGQNGQVKDPAHFGNSEWNCWDIELMDIDC